jgi:hypothetical protein
VPTQAQWLYLRTALGENARYTMTEPFVAIDNSPYRFHCQPSGGYYLFADGIPVDGKDEAWYFTSSVDCNKQFCSDKVRVVALAAQLPYQRLESRALTRYGMSLRCVKKT